MVDKIEIKTTETGLSLEEEAAALETAGTPPVEPKLAGEDDTPERPEWLPEKFATVEDMAKAYAELEKGNSAGKPEDTPEADEAAVKAVTEAGLDMDALSAEYSDKGELTPESLEALAKVGITPDMVKSYIAGQTAETDKARETLLAPVGGEEAYTDLITWAADNVPSADIDAYNSVLEGGDPNSIKMAVENLNAKYLEANGQEPAVFLSGKPNTAGTAVYESTADLMKDMGNPEYAKNPAFRAKVEAKLGRSNIM